MSPDVLQYIQCPWQITTCIGKRRTSIQAQLLAVEILSKISIKAASVDMFDKYQICSRYMILSSTMEKNGLIKESIATMAVALWSIIEEMKISAETGMVEDEASVGDTIAEHVLLFPATYASSVETNESVLFSVLSKLTRSYINSRQTLLEPDTARAEEVSNCLSKTLIGKLLDVASSSSNEGKELHLSKLLHYAIWNQKRYEVLSTPQLAEIIRLVLLAMSRTVKRCVTKGNDSNILHLIEEAKTYLQAQKKRVGDVTDRDVNQVLSSSFHTYFAAILMESKYIESPRPSLWMQCKGVENSDQLLLKHSYGQLQHADHLFQDDSTQEDIITDACFFAQWAAIQFRQAILMEYLCLGKIACDVPSMGGRSFVRYNHSALEKYRVTLSKCCRAIELFDEELFPEVVQSLLITLESLLYRFCSIGDAVSSIQSFSLLQQVSSSLSQPLRMISSISAFALASSTLEHSLPLFINATYFSENIDTETLDDEEEASFDSLRFASEAICSVIHAHEKLPITSFDEHALLRLSKYIDEHVERLTIEDVDTDEMLLLVQLQAIVTRVHFIIAKIFMNTGKPNTGLHFLNSCRHECKKQINLLRTIGKYHDCPLGNAMEQADDLLSMCYEGLASALAALGIRRNAEDYAVSAVLKRKILSSDEFQRVSEVNVQQIVDFASDADGLDSVLHSIRTLLRTKHLSSSLDKIASEPLELKSSLLPKMDTLDAAQIHQFTCRSKTLLSCEFLYHRILPVVKSFLRSNLFLFSTADNDALKNISSFGPKAQAYIDRACQGHEELLKSDSDYLSSIAATHAELSLRKFRGTHSKKSASSLLNRVTCSPNASAICIAQAEYELGLIALEKARDRGELRSLWHGYSVSNDRAVDGEYPPLQHILEARKHFQHAIRQAGSTANKFTKDVLRCLALTTGPEDSDATSFFIHASIGGSIRNSVLDIAQNEANSSTQLLENICALLYMFDDESKDYSQRIKSFKSLLQEYASLLHDAWTVSSVTICPTGEILVSSLRKEAIQERNVVIKSSNICIIENNVQSDLLIPLDQIIERSQRQLHGMTEEAQTEQYNEESVRRKWWKDRHKIDDDLRSLLEYAQTEYFGHSLLKNELIQCENQKRGEQSDDDSSESSSCRPKPARLASRFERVENEESDTASLKKLTVVVLKERLRSLGVVNSEFHKMRKAELVELLASKMEQEINDCSMESVQETALSCMEPFSAQDQCTILILDEHLQRFPFESMDMFEGQAVTRVPSLPFVFVTLVERESLSIDPERVSYVLDPESNLSETASNLGPALNNLASSRGWEWNGLVGEMPSEQFMTEILKNDHGMYLYCGHGGGEKFFSRNQVEDLMMSREDGIRGCRPPIVLMGCSSGKLQSVNCPKGHEFIETSYPIHYEPEGIALSYLIAGAPCVVGNLWDVTDRDIDRYCLTLMEDFVQGHGNSLAKCVAEARRACKLRYIVGSAPVYYGVPLKCSSRKAALAS